MFIKADTPPVISIIVPVFNVQDYLSECLSSLADQTFNHSYEIILIDDCSTDNSKTICESFVADHPGLARLICLDKNSGVSVARNQGIRAATGTYFAFVDSDDWLPANALEHLYSAAIKHQADVVKGNCIVFDEYKSRPANHNVKNEKIYQNEAIFAAFLQHRDVRGHTWGKLFLRASFGHIVCPQNVTMAEDTLYCAEVFSQAKKLVLINTCVYNYRLRASGATGRKFHTCAYLWWLHSIESCGHFVSNPTQQRHLKALQIRTLLQLIKEARSLQTEQLRTVLSEVMARQQQWQLNIPALKLALQIPPRVLFHFLRFTWELKQLNARLRSNPGASSFQY